ncbi:hypothetical protein B9L19_14760 [Geobacillus thermocatenulatus]|uniref:Uncharacterized protein n=1 Tax=Geobacillus thermocatenulatus TaxID=33938 RepID=A0A226Q571_9BACL|nr:hypothetical protein GT3921_15865 [Geobacillus thermocatenulatus]KLR72386.1 hypothetical protein ABH20_16675 [Geobacillus sp. T6]OXB86749.1 hypothetical protein B9L19_14760 [Geobacillus thermocatenulatus]
MYWCKFTDKDVHFGGGNPFFDIEYLYSIPFSVGVGHFDMNIHEKYSFTSLVFQQFIRYCDKKSPKQ